MDKSPDAFRTISEVADLLETPAHVLRFWESRFTQVRPVKRAGGRRYYRPTDVALLAGIRLLLHDQGMTIRGVQKILREQGVRHVCSLAQTRALVAEAEQEWAGEDALDVTAAVGVAPQPDEGRIIAWPGPRPSENSAGAEPEAMEAGTQLSDDGAPVSEEAAATDAEPAPMLDASPPGDASAPAYTDRAPLPHDPFADMPLFRGIAPEAAREMEPPPDPAESALVPATEAPDLAPIAQVKGAPLETAPDAALPTPTAAEPLPSADSVPDARAIALRLRAVEPGRIDAGVVLHMARAMRALRQRLDTAPGARG
ncbi:MAG: MerR family transcriptional regulator [Gemmobacter sp.]|nr:MerR family transcriptional regulator [Gemmobacter sp.]